MTYHANISASSLPRLFACPGSYQLCKGLKDRSSNSSEEGTIAHEIRAKLILNQSYSQADYPNFDFENNLDFILGSVESAKRYIEKGTSFYVEKAVPLNLLTGELNAIGTADLIVPAGEMLIFEDFKFGIGHRVYPHENEQLLAYAASEYLGEKQLTGFAYKKFKLVIHQPRVNEEALEWDCDEDYILNFIERVRALIIDVNSADAQLNPGVKQCAFCKVRANCPAIIKSINFSCDPYKMSAEELTKYKQLIPVYDIWKKAVNTVMEDRLVGGELFPAHELALGSPGNRRWLSTDLVLAALEEYNIETDLITEIKIKGPAPAEKLFKKLPVWKRLNDLMYRPPAKLTVKLKSGEGITNAE